MFASLPFCSGAYSSHTEYTDTVDRIDLVVGFGAHDELVLMDGQIMPPSGISDTVAILTLDLRNLRLPDLESLN
jgi:hypothetical protein